VIKSQEKLSQSYQKFIISPQSQKSHDNHTKTVQNHIITLKVFNPTKKVHNRTKIKSHDNHTKKFIITQSHDK